MVFEGLEASVKAFFSGRCQAYTTDASGLASIRNKEASNPDDYVILPDLISKEPLGPAVRRGDDEWFAIAKWVIFALLEAEEYGITQANVDKMKASNDPAVQRILGTGEDTGKLLGLDKDWAYRAIKSVGNYGEIFERNVGPKSALQAAARPQQPVEQGRPDVRAADPLTDSRRLEAPSFAIARERFQWLTPLRRSLPHTAWLVLAQPGVPRRRLSDARGERDRARRVVSDANTLTNLRIRGIQSGFDFLSSRRDLASARA